MKYENGGRRRAAMEPRAVVYTAEEHKRSRQEKVIKALIRHAGSIGINPVETAKAITAALQSLDKVPLDKAIEQGIKDIDSMAEWDYKLDQLFELGSAMASAH